MHTSFFLFCKAKHFTKQEFCSWRSWTLPTKFNWGVFNALRIHLSPWYKLKQLKQNKQSNKRSGSEPSQGRKKTEAKERPKGEQPTRIKKGRELVSLMVGNYLIIHSGLVWNTKCLLILTSWFSQVSKLTHDKSTCTLSHAHWHVFKCTLHIATCMLPSFWVHISMVFKCTLHIATCMYWQVVKHGWYFMSQ